MSDHAGPVSRSEAPSWSSQPSDAPVCLPETEEGFPIYLDPVGPVVEEPLFSDPYAEDTGFGEDVGPVDTDSPVGEEPAGETGDEPAEESVEEPAEEPAEEDAVDAAEEGAEEAAGGPGSDAAGETSGEEGGGEAAEEGGIEAAEDGGAEASEAAAGTVTAEPGAVGEVVGQGAGHAAAGAVAGPPALVRRAVIPARIGGTQPPRVGEPPPLAPKVRAEIERRTGLTLDEHHDRIRAGVGRISAVAHRAQVDIIQLIEGLGSDLYEEVRADADRIPGFVAGLVARIETRVGQARREVDAARDSAHNLITLMVDETQAGLDEALELNSDNVVTLLGEASTQVRDLYETTLSGEYQLLAGQYADDIETYPVCLTPSIESMGTSAQLAFEAGEVGSDTGYPATRDFINEQQALAAVPHATDVLDALNAEASARAAVLTSPEAEGSFAMGVLAAVDESAVIFDDAEDAADEVCTSEAEAQPPRLATPRERALRRLDVAQRDAHQGLDELLENARTSLTRAGRQAQQSFRQQAIEGETALRALAPDMATAWRTYVRQLDPMVPPGRVLDWTRLGPILHHHEAAAATLRAGQARSVRDQARETKKGIDHALRALRADLAHTADTLVKNVGDIQDRAIRRIRLASEALDPFRAYGDACVSHAETWASDADKGLSGEMLDRIAAQARSQLSGGEESLEVKFFQKKYQEFLDEAEPDKKRDALDPSSSEPDEHYLSLATRVEKLVEDKATAVYTAGVKDDGIVFGATDEDMMLQALMGLTTRGMDAVRERFREFGEGTLDNYVLGELDDDSTEKSAGRRLLSGDTTGALQDIIKAGGLSWETTEAALLALTPDDVAHIRNEPGWDETLAALDRRVYGTNNQIAHALIEGDREKAAALRIEADAQAARDADDVTKTLDVAANIEAVTSKYMGSSTALVPPTRRQRQAFTEGTLVAHAVLVGSAAPGAALTPDQARSLFAEHLTRTYTTTEYDSYDDGYGGGSSYEVTHQLSDTDAERVREVVEHPEDSALVQATRTTTLLQGISDGDASDAQLVSIVETAEDRELYDAERDLRRIRQHGSEAEIAQAQRRYDAAVRHHTEYLQNTARLLGADDATLADPAAVERFVSERISRAVGDKNGWGPIFAESIVHTGRPDLLASTWLATGGWGDGTNEALLDATYADHTWEEFDDLRERFAANHGTPDNLNALDEHLGTFGGAGFGTELSGDDRQRIERLMVLDAGSDRGIAAAAMLDFRHTQENGDTGKGAVDGTGVGRRLYRNQDDLVALLSETAEANGGGSWAFDEHGRPNPAAFGPDGKFLGDRERLHAYGVRGESRREAYNAAVDRAESFWTSLIQAIGTLIAAIVLIVGSFVPGLNVVLWLAVGALVTGAALIATKMAFRGGRYGWEEMMVDVGTTVVDAALAVVGAKGATQAFKQGVKQSVVFAAKQGAKMGFLGGVGHAMLQERTWQGGFLEGLGKLALAGGKGAIVGATTGALSAGIGNRLGPSATAEMGSAHNLLADAVGDAVGQFAGSLLGTGMDALTGDYGGSFAQAFENATMSAFFEGLASPVRAVGMRRFQARTRFPMEQELLASQVRDPTPDQLHQLYTTAREGLHARGMTFEAFVEQFHRRRAETQTRRVNALGDLPDPIRAQFDAIATDTLESLVRASQDGGDPAELVQRLARDNPDLTPDQVTVLAGRLLEGIHTAREQAVQMRRSILEAVPPEVAYTLGALSTTSLARLVDLANTEAGPTLQDRFRLYKEALARNPGLKSADFVTAVRTLVTAAREARLAANNRQRGQRAALLARIPAAQRGPFGRLPLPVLDAVGQLVARGDFGTPEQRKAIVAAARAADSTLTPDRILGALDASVRARQPEVATGPLRAAILDAVPPHLRGAFDDVEIQVVPVHLFEEHTGSARARAVVEFEDGKARVLVRADADLTALREEGLHLLQARDPEWRSRIGQLDEGRMRQWDSLTVDEQVAMYRTKLEIEIDAQRRLLEELHAEGDRSPAGLARIAIAETTQENLLRRLAEVDALGPLQTRAIRWGWSPRPQYLAEPPRLFNKLTEITPERVAEIRERVRAAREGNAEADRIATTALRAHDTEPAPDVTHAGVTYAGVVHVQNVFGTLTLGGGFAAIANATTRFGFDPSRDLVIGGPNPWDGSDAGIRLGQKTTGNVDLPAAHVPFADTVVQPGPEHYTMAREHGDHVAVNRHEAGVPVTEGRIVRVELRGATTAGWPAWASSAKVRVLVGDSPTGPWRWVYAEGADIAMGPGPGRLPGNFEASKPPWDTALAARLAAVEGDPVLDIDAATLADLQRTNRIVAADQGTTSSLFLPGKDVAVMGGGASGAWITAMGAMSEANVEWVAFARGLRQIAEIPDVARRDRLIAAWNELVTTGRIADPTLAADLQTFAFQEQIGHGYLPRNRDEEAQGIFHPDMASRVDWRIAPNLQRVTWDPTTQRFAIYYEGNPVPVYKDQIIFAIGQDPMRPGAAGHVLDSALARTFEPILSPDGTRVLGLQTDGGTIRIMGASATMDPLLEKFVESGHLSATRRMLREAGAAIPDVDSRGVVMGFYHSKEMIEGANAIARVAAVEGMLPPHLAGTPVAAVDLPPGVHARVVSDGTSTRLEVGPHATPEHVRAAIADLEQTAVVRRAIEDLLTPDERAAIRNARIEIWDDDAYRAFTESSTSHAAVIIKNGEPVVIVRRGADLSLIGEEGFHLLQADDSRTMGRMLRLDEETLARWPDLSVRERLGLYRIQLDLEIEAQQRVIRALEGRVGAEPELQGRIDQARRNIEGLRGKQVGPVRRLLMRIGWMAPPEWLSQPARLFAKASLVDQAAIKAAKLGDDGAAFQRFVELYAKTSKQTATIDRLLEAFQAKQVWDPATNRFHTEALTDVHALPRDQFVALLQARFPHTASWDDAQITLLRQVMNDYLAHTRNGGLSLQEIVDHVTHKRIFDTETQRFSDASSGETTAQNRRRLIDAIGPTRWNQIATQAAATHGTALKAIVPIEGVYRLKGADGNPITFGKLFDQNPHVVDEIVATLRDSLVQLKNLSPEDADDAARVIITELRKNNVVLVKGTSHVRDAVNYDRDYRAHSSNKNLHYPSIAEVHHLHPLYLGGSHTLANLLALDGTPHGPHDRIHALFDSLKLDGGSLNASALQHRYAGDLQPGYAVVLSNGEVLHRLVNDPP